jgi:hypothetical protein
MIRTAVFLIFSFDLFPVHPAVLHAISCRLCSMPDCLLSCTPFYMYFGSMQGSPHFMQLISHGLSSKRPPGSVAAIRAL